MANETSISFYLKLNRIHIFVEALRRIGSPQYICFLVEENGKSMVMKPYPKKDFISLAVPRDVYNSVDSMEVSSIRLCTLLSQINSWNPEKSYRVPGKIYSDQKMILFDFSKAEKIN